MTAIEEVVDSTAFINGPAVRAFEKEVAAYLGVKHAVGVNSGTDALVIGLRALGIGPG
ncbi:MAG: DegT/DnrJ/EryC1/StrS family aminotransferase, partial [Planctomycetes bacterium]|nr:DegT/DnrJ/EryC1/StrS family aminotransferase [Planctomycetota bacterium]